MTMTKIGKLMHGGVPDFETTRICNSQKAAKSVVKPIINHSFGNGLYHLLMMIWGIVYEIVFITL